MSHVYDSIAQLKKMLGNLDRWIEKGAAFAKVKPFDPAVLVASRLAPDQYPLLRQVQAACDAAKFAAARASGKEAPKHPDTEQTLDEVRSRIQTCVAYLDTFSPADFGGIEARTVELSFFKGKATDYLNDFAIPNHRGSR